MLLFFHIFIALFSLVFSSYTLLSPTLIKLKGSWGLAGLTLLTGTYLVLTTHVHILSACISGLVYLGIVFSELALARQRLHT